MPKVSDVDTHNAALSVTGLTVTTSNAGTIEEAYSTVTSDAQTAPVVGSSVFTALTVERADAGLTTGQGNHTVFKDGSDNLFAYTVIPNAGGAPTYSSGF